MDKIYILVPVYNVENYLERCINSILNQTYTNWELVLVNDGSKDGSGAICDRYAAKHDNITVIHQENGGVSVARNTAVAYALEHGDHEQDWINFVDSDDFVHPFYLEYLYRAAKGAGTDTSSCSYIETTDSETDFSNTLTFKFNHFSAEEYWCKRHDKAIVVWGNLYKLKLLNNIQFPVGKIAEDQITSYKIIFQCNHVAFTPEKLYYYYCNASSIMRTTWSPRMLDELDAKEEHADFFAERNLPDAYKLAVREWYLCSIKHLRYIENLSPQYNHLKKSVRAKGYQAFRLYAREVGYKEAIVFWYEARIIRPIKRVLKNESVFSFLKRRLKKRLFRR